MNDVPHFQIGDCPKCGKRTFVVYDYVKEGKQSWTKPLYSAKNIIKGQCYHCGEVKELEY